MQKSILFCMQCRTISHWTHVMTIVNSIFLDSETVKSYEIGRTKHAYVVNFGLRPYLHGLLTESIKKLWNEIIPFHLMNVWTIHFKIAKGILYSVLEQQCKSRWIKILWFSIFVSPYRKKIYLKVWPHLWQRLIVLIRHNCLWLAQVWTGYSLIFLESSVNNKSYLNCSTLGVATFV